MSTRSFFTFTDDEKQTFAVYKHCDGYPSGAAKAIADALSLAWELPRFEADEFAAAFVAANKNCGGGIRLLTSFSDAPDDCEYRYDITRDPSGAPLLYVRAFALGAGKPKRLFSGTLDGLALFAVAYES